jgi:hypothetical protein
MFSHALLFFIIPLLISGLTVSESTSDKLMVLGSNSNQNDLKAWVNFHKESGKIDSILRKCYDCIRDRNIKEDG